MGIVFDIKRGSIKDGPGLRTSVFLKGCPLRCVWCHNPESQEPGPQRAVTTDEICGREMSVEEVMCEVAADKPFYGAEGGLTLTGGEPLAQPDFAFALASAAKREGIHVSVDTCGYVPWTAFERMLPVTDLFLYDLKCMDPIRHKELTGADNALILDNLRRLDAAGAKTWIRFPLVPGLNDSDADLEALRDFVGTLVHVQRTEICAYHSLGLAKYEKFGLVPGCSRNEPATAEDVARWKRLLVPMKNVMLAAFLVVSASAAAAEFWVDHEQGDDANPGTRSRPFKTFEKSRAALRGGDRLNVVPTATPYDEPLGWFRQELHSGTTDRPTVIDGHGARLTGLRTMPPNAWTNVGENVWAAPFRHNVVCMSHKGYYDGFEFAFLNGRPMPMAKSRETMRDGEAFLHLQYDSRRKKLVEDFHALYVKLPPGCTPSKDVIQVAQPAGARIFCDNIVVENFVCDWTSADFFDTERKRGIVIRNVKTDHTMDQGVSSHSTAGCRVEDSEFRRSLSGGALDVTLEPGTPHRLEYVRCAFGEMLKGMGIGIGCQGVGNEVVYAVDDCEFRDCATAAVRVRQDAQVTVRRARITNPKGPADGRTAAFECGMVGESQSLEVSDSTVRDCPVGIRLSRAYRPVTFSRVDFGRVKYAAQVTGTLSPGSVVFRRCTFPAEVKVLQGERELSPEEAERAGVRFEDCTFVKERKVFAHYMGGMNALRGAGLWYRYRQSAAFREKNDYITRIGGYFGAWPLVPEHGTNYVEGAEEENALLEIRRALRAGIDGFAIDAWADGKQAMRQFDVFIRTAEKHRLPFEMTVCFDPSCHGCMPGKDNLEKYIGTGKYVLRHRDSPNLARFGGKPLFFGYFSDGIARGRIDKKMPLGERERIIADCWRAFRAAMGEEVFLHGSLDGMIDLSLGRGNPFQEIGTWAATVYDAVGGFIGEGEFGWGRDAGLISAVRRGGAVWSQPLWAQYSNPRGGIITGAGLELLRRNWEAAIANGSELLQFVTWNDYGEASMLAPSTATGYTLSKVNRHYAGLWKNGRAPVVTNDEVHVVFRNTVGDAAPFPFGGRNRPVPEELEVVTFLTAPTRVVVSGYGDYEAEAGMGFRRFPLRVGKIRVSLQREGKTVLDYTAPEEVSDKRWRENFTMVACGSDLESEWKRDFPDTPVVRFAEMGDADGDGLPNWFEMVYFGKYPYMCTATVADPQDDPDGDGLANLEEYRRDADPTKPEEPYRPGFVWDTRDIRSDAFVFNPHRDAHRQAVWHWFYDDGTGRRLFEFTVGACEQKRGYMHGHDKGWYDAYRREYPSMISFDKTTGEIEAKPVGNVTISVGWRAPVSGRVRSEDGVEKDVRKGDFLYFPLHRPLMHVRLTLLSVHADERDDGYVRIFNGRDLLFLGHTMPVRFRNIEIKEL